MSPTTLKMFWPFMAVSVISLVGCSSNDGITLGQTAVSGAVDLAANASKNHADKVSKAIGSAQKTKASNCPALIKSGTWSADPTGQGTILSNAREPGLSAVTRPGQSSSYKVEIKPSCQPGFTMTVQDFSVEMNPVGTDRQSRETVYVGKMPANRVNATYVFRNSQPQQGLMDLVVSGLTKGGDGSTTWRHKLNYAGQNRQRVECQCRELLKKEIQEAIKDAKRWVDIYSDKSLQEKPNQWNAYGTNLEWNPTAYDAVLDLMYLDPSTPLTQAKAVEKLSTDAINKPNSPRGDSAEANNAAAYVDSKTCEITFGTDHLKYCNSEVIKESTIRHETLHQAQCQARRVKPLSNFVAEQTKKNNDRLARGETSNPFGSKDKFYEPNTSIPEFAQNEIDSYQSEIEFLQNWIPNNCS